MVGYLVRRLGYLVPTWLGLSVLAFVIGSLAPGDPVRSYFQRSHGRPPTPDELQLLRDQFGLDDPLPVRFLDWVTGAVQGDLGMSFTTGRPVVEELLSRFPATLQLAGAAMVVAFAIAVPVGIVSAVYRNRLVDQLVRVGSLLGASLPGFFLAYLLIMLLSVELRLLPTLGRGSWKHLVMPALALGLTDSAILARLMRSSLLEVLGENHVRTAQAKGVAEWKVVWRHGVMNSLNAVVTEAGLTFAALLAFSAIIEVIFVWPGIGRLILEAITQRDYPIIQGFVIFAGTIFVLINLAVDVAYVWLDPRVTLGERRRPPQAAVAA
ncbi:MAG: ABC transporter permease [Actinomycetota bacterium]|nr:ABC transporter permease [Actinomycetota bacterium]